MIDTFVSVVCVIENDFGILDSRLHSIQSLLKENYSDYEIVLIDQHSNKATVDKLKELMLSIPCIRHIRLGQRVKYDVALAAGAENAIGDYIVIMSIRRDPEGCITDLVKKCVAGAHIVIGVCPAEQSASYKVFEPLLNKVLSKFGLQLPKSATDLRCLSREVVNVITETGRYHHKFFVRISNTGFPFVEYAYSIRDNSNNIPKSLRFGLKETFRTLIFNSTAPLRWMSGLGLFGSFIAFLFSAYSLLANLVSGNVAEGWTTLVLFTSILFMFLFIILAFFGEYLGRLLDDRSEKRDYSVLSEEYSSVMINEKRVNIFEE